MGLSDSLIEMESLGEWIRLSSFPRLVKGFSIPFI